MKLLILSNNPDRASFRQRIGIYTGLLQKADIDCCIEKLPAGYLARWRLFKKAGEFAGVFLHKKCLNHFDAKVLRKHARKIIYDFDDAVMYSPRNPENDYSSHFRLFRRTVMMADTVIAGNSYLAEHASRFNNNVNILPTGLDMAKYGIEVYKPKDNKVRLVWIGSKSTLKYLAEIKPALEQVGSAFNNVVLRVICDEFIHFRKLPVENHNWSEQTEAADLKQCDIGLAPLPDNRFTRGKCGFKILQYYSANMPVVASPVGVNIGFVRGDTTGFFAENQNQWVDKIAALVNGSKLRQNMGLAGHQFAQSFDVACIGKSLCELILKCISD